MRTNPSRKSLQPNFDSSKLTDEAPAAPESVYGLETIEDVFQRFEPTVDLCHVDAEGNVKSKGNHDIHRTWRLRSQED